MLAVPVLDVGQPRRCVLQRGSSSDGVNCVNRVIDVSRRDGMCLCVSS